MIAAGACGVAAELDVERALAGALVIALDDAEVFLERFECDVGEGDFLLGGNQVAPCLGGVGGQ